MGCGCGGSSSMMLYKITWPDGDGGVSTAYAKDIATARQTRTDNTPDDKSYLPVISAVPRASVPEGDIPE
jgi:hypothetical protein